MTEKSEGSRQPGKTGSQIDRCINNKALKFHLRMMDTGVTGRDWDLYHARDRRKDRLSSIYFISLLLRPLIWAFCYKTPPSSFSFLSVIPRFIPLPVSLSSSRILTGLSESWCAALQCNVFSLQPCSDSPVPSVTVCWTHTDLSSWASL